MPPPPPPIEVPDFVEPIGNHTVAVGRDAQLACKINKLGSFRTAWLRVEDKGILTIHNNVITRNYRVGLINNDDEAKNFILTIKNVQPSDRVSAQRNFASAMNNFGTDISDSHSLLSRSQIPFPRAATCARSTRCPCATQ